MLCKCIFIFAHQHVVPPTSDIARNPRKCGERCAKASRKLKYLNQALLSQTATLGSGRLIKSHVFNVRPLMKGCDSFIVKWQGPPRKLAKEVFVKFILAKEKMRSRKSGERFWRKTMWLEKKHTRFSAQLTWTCCFKASLNGSNLKWMVCGLIFPKAWFWVSLVFEDNLIYIPSNICRLQMLFKAHEESVSVAWPTAWANAAVGGVVERGQFLDGAVYSPWQTWKPAYQQVALKHNVFKYLNNVPKGSLAMIAKTLYTWL